MLRSHRITFTRALVRGTAFSIALCTAAASHAGQTGRSNPLAGDGVHAVVDYYDYSADGITNDQIIHDLTNNTIDTVPLQNPNPYYAFLGNPPTRDDLATTLVDGSSHLDHNGGAPESPFQYSNGAGLNFLLPGSRVLDTAATGHGAISITKNMLTHQNISDAGGFTFETYLKRTTDTTGVAKQIIWTPEGSHPMEITQAGNFQIQLSGLTDPITAPAATALPLNTWHHVMAVLKVTQPLPPGGNPAEDPLVANYSLYLDGGLLGTTPNANLTGGSCCILEFLDHEHGIGGSEFGAAGEYFRGQLALTRLSLGALTVEQSLMLPPALPNSGDYNGNGVVDAADYVLWRKTQGNGVAPGAGADGSANGMIDPADYTYWRSRFGLPGGSGAGFFAAAAVPEPTAALLVLAGVLTLVCSSFRQRS